jgi:hypothetical protein
MWVIRAYNPEDDEMAREYNLDAIDSAALERILGFSPTQYGSTPLDFGALSRLSRTFNWFREQRQSQPLALEYFLDYDAGPSPAVPRQGRRGHSASATA